MMPPGTGSGEPAHRPEAPDPGHRAGEALRCSTPATAAVHRQGPRLSLAPGPDSREMAGCSISQGRTAGMVLVLDISSGCMAHTVAAAFELSAVLAASAEGPPRQVQELPARGFP